jgi:peptide chain release factor 1
MEEKAQEIVSKYENLNKELLNPATLSNSLKIKEISIEIDSIKDLYSLSTEYLKLFKEVEDTKNLLQKALHEEEKVFYQNYLEESQNKLSQLEDTFKKATIVFDPNDKRNIILEIRAGTGGEEASLFASELYRMYLKFAENNSWQIEQLSISHSSTGGIKEVICSLKGNGVYGLLKYESGVHRVQRVPSTEAAGRIHTSSASVVVLPEVEDFEVEINPDDIKLDLFRAGGPGGQGVNTTDSAVRLTHIPTGIVVSCQDERSQLKNKHRAMMVLKSKIYDLELSKKQEVLSSQRKSAIKTGDRSDKIRTYNYPQSRVTDHRIKVSWYNLHEILSGNIGPMIETIKENIDNANVA